MSRDGVETSSRKEYRLRGRFLGPLPGQGSLLRREAITPVELGRFGKA
jgi:hypothetical protein